MNRRYRMFRKWCWQSLAALTRDFNIATEQRLSGGGPETYQHFRPDDLILSQPRYEAAISRALGFVEPALGAVDTAIRAKEWGAKVKVGWNPSHVQPTGITPARAQAGGRPT